MLRCGDLVLLSKSFRQDEDRSLDEEVFIVPYVCLSVYECELAETNDVDTLS